MLNDTSIDFNKTIKFDGQDYVSDLEIKNEFKEKIPNMEKIMEYFSEGMTEKNKGERQFPTEGGNKSLGEMRILNIDAGNDKESLAVQSLIFSMVAYDTHIRSFPGDIADAEAIVGGLAMSEEDKALEEFFKIYPQKKK